MFQEERYGDQQWNFDVTAGQKYEVRLYFAEIYFGGNGNGGGDGSRTFDVSVEGQKKLNDYDIYAEVGHDVGTVKSYTVTPSDSTLDINFTTEVNNAKISAVEVVKAEPQPDELGASPSSADLGTVVTGNSESETVAVTNLGGDGDPNVDITGVSITGADGSEFSAGSASQTTLAPGESAGVTVTFAPSDAQAKAATLEITHTGSNSPLTVDLTGEGVSDVPVGFGSDSLNFGGALTGLEFGPDDRLYVSDQGGKIYALNITRTGDDSYSVESQETIGAIQTIPNHDDDGTLNTGQNQRQVTGLTVGGTASQPIVYVSSSDPRIGGGGSGTELDLDTNSGAISRLTLDRNPDGSLSNVDHEVMVFGLPRSEENHAPNDLDLSDDGDTLYLAQGGNTNKGAPSNNFAYTPEYALSAAVLSIDLAQIENNFAEKNLQTYSPPTGTGSYPDLPFYYAIPTIQTDDSTDGDDLPFGGQDGVNMAKWVENGPVQVYSSGYRNPYGVVLSEDGQVYTFDNGPNSGWGGQPADANGNTDESACTNHPNEDGSFSTGDQIHLATEGSYGGHAVPIRGNPTGADIYDENGNVVLDINSSNTPVPSSLVNPEECDYQPPSEDNSLGDTLGWAGDLEEYTASNFGGAMQGDLLAVEGGSTVERIELNATGKGVTDQEDLLTPGSALAIETVGDDGPFPGTIWTARGSLNVYEPNDYEGNSQQCSGADNSSLDEDDDGYDNADEIDAGTNPCSAGSFPADFDGDGESNLNDNDDDDDGIPDDVDPFAVDPDNGLSTTLPVDASLTATDLFSDNSQIWTGLMTNGQDDYQDLYDVDSGPGVVGGAAGVLTVEGVTTGDAVNNDQENAFQFGVDAPNEQFTITTTVNGFPDNPSNSHEMGIYLGNGDQDNYVKLIVAANGGTGGIQFAKETGGSFSTIEQPDDSSVTGPATNTDLSLTVDPTTDPTPNDGTANAEVTAEYATDGGNTVAVGSGEIPAAWLDSSDGNGTAVGIISTSLNAGSTFDATWKDISVTSETDAPAGETEVLYRVNAGGPEIEATDSGPDWAADTGPSQYLVGGDSNTVDWATSGTGDAALNGGVDSSVPSSTPTEVFTYERYDPPTDGEMQWEFPVQSGTEVAVRLYFADQWEQSPDPEERIFNVSLEDSVVLENYNISAEFGDDAGGAESFTVTSDGTVDVDFTNVSQNPVVNAIEIVEADDTDETTVAEAVAGPDNKINLTEIQAAIDTWAKSEEVPGTGGETIDLDEIQSLIDTWAEDETVGGGDNAAPTLDALSDQTVAEGDSETVSVSASDADGDSLTLSKTSGPSFVTLTDNGDGTGTLDITPTSGDAADSPYTVEVEATDGTGGLATESFQVTVDSASSTSVLYRVDAGNGTDTSPVDGGPVWAGVTGTQSQFLTSLEDGNTASGTNCAGADITPTSSVPSSTPEAVFNCEMYGDMTWAFDVETGTDVEVRLYVGNQFNGTSQPGQRQYNVSVENQQVLTQYDPVADVGHANGTVKSFTTTSDGTVDITIEAGAIENPLVNGIEIVETSSGGSS